MCEISIHLMIATALSTVILFRMVSKLFGQPLVIGEIIAGLMMGMVLSRCWTAFNFEISIQQLTSPLISLGNLGLVFIVLDALFQTEKRVTKTGVEVKQLAFITLSNVVPSLLMGGLMSAGYLIYHPTDSYLPFVLLTATSISISAVPVLARILEELNLQRSRLGKIALQTACWTDAVAWVLVGLALSIHRHSGGLQFTLESFGFAFTLLVMLIGFRRLFFNYFANSRSTTKTILIILLFSAGITQLASLHIVLGAFLVGLVFSKNTQVVINWKRDLKWITEKFFCPIFFVTTGMNVVSNQSITWDQVGWGFGFLIISIGSKLIPLYFSSRKVGLSQDESRLISLLLNARGLMEIVVLTVGLQAGIYKPEQFTIFLIVALCTTLICVPLCKYVLMNTHHKMLGNAMGIRQAL